MCPKSIIAIVFGLILLSALPSATAAEPKCDGSLLEPENLQALIKRHKIKGIKDIVTRLPDCYTANHAMAYASSSLQCATPKAPRIIIYMKEENSRDRGTVCAFNSGSREDYAELYKKNPSLDCHENEMECQRFIGGDEAKFEYYRVVASETDQGRPNPTIRQIPGKLAQVSKINPPECMTSCHRGVAKPGFAPDPRPNLEAYPFWPGFYGSVHDRMFKLSDGINTKADTKQRVPFEENAYRAQFLPYKRKNPRYAVLRDYVDSSLKSIRPRPEYMHQEPTIELQNVLGHQNFQRLARKWTNPETRKRIWPFRYAVLAALTCNTDSARYQVDGNGYGSYLFANAEAAKDRFQALKPEPGKPLPSYSIESFLPESIKKRFATSYAQSAKKVLRLHQKNYKALVELHEKLAGPLPTEIAEVARTDLSVDSSLPESEYRLDFNESLAFASRLSYLAENLGIPTDDWTTSFHESLDFRAGRHNPAQITEFLLPKLLDPVKDKDLDGLYLGGYRMINVEKCDLLRQKSLEAIESAVRQHQVDLGPCAETVEAAQPEAPLPIVGPVLEQVHDSSSKSSKYPQAPALVQECIKCHVHGEETHIPFDQPRVMKALLQQPSPDGHGRLLEMVIGKIQSGSMPYNIPTTNDQKLELINYFKKLIEAREEGEESGPRRSD